MVQSIYKCQSAESNHPEAFARQTKGWKGRNLIPKFSVQASFQALSQRSHQLTEGSSPSTNLVMPHSLKALLGAAPASSPTFPKSPHSSTLCLIIFAYVARFAWKSKTKQNKKKYPLKTYLAFKALSLYLFSCEDFHDLPSIPLLLRQN